MTPSEQALKAAEQEMERASEEQLRAAVTEAGAWFSGDHIERIVAKQLEEGEFPDAT